MKRRRLLSCQKHVGGGVHQMRQRLVVGKDETRLAGEAVAHFDRHVVEGALFVAVGGRTQEHELSAALQRPPACVLDEMNPLLSRPPSNHTTRFRSQLKA